MAKLENCCSSKHSPKVTVLMSVYNGEQYLREAIESILGQTFTDFEFLIINDDSTDNSVDIVESYHDLRIRLIHNSINIGLTKSLNKGLELAQGTYIARMDADDICYPMRLERQINFMDGNNSVGLCGTWLQTIEEKKTIWKPPIEDNIIRASMIFENVLYHPTTLFRRDLLKENKICYDESLPCAQDYAFWLRWSAYTKLANIDEVLLNYRIHPESIGATHKTKQQDIASQIRFLQIKKIGLTPDNQELSLHNDISRWSFQCSREFVLSSEEWLIKLQNSNKTTSWLPEPAFSRVLSERWYRICRNAQKLGPWTWRIFWQSALSNFITLRLINEIGFGSKCLLRI